MRTFKTLFVFLVFALFSVVALSGNKEYKLGGNATLKGTVKLQKFYGPPGYGENPQKDKVEMHYVLLLDKPIDVLAEKDSGYSSVQGVSMMQMYVLSKNKNIKFKSLKGSKVTVSGILVPQETGHHHTEVLIEVSSVSVTKKK